MFFSTTLTVVTVGFAALTSAIPLPVIKAASSIGCETSTRSLWFCKEMLDSAVAQQATVDHDGMLYKQVDSIIRDVGGLAESTSGSVAASMVKTDTVDGSIMTGRIAARRPWILIDPSSEHMRPVFIVAIVLSSILVLGAIVGFILVCFSSHKHSQKTSEISKDRAEGRQTANQPGVEGQEVSAFRNPV